MMTGLKSAADMPRSVARVPMTPIVKPSLVGSDHEHHRFRARRKAWIIRLNLNTASSRTRMGRAYAYGILGQL
jgi:hypothetical protein